MCDANGAESVRVVVKCRPMNQRERSVSADDVIVIDAGRAQCSISNPAERAVPPKVFTFDGAYGPDSTNEQLYADVAFPLVDGVTEGYNGTVFAYGQTGCGKTFTMQGDGKIDEQLGVIPRAFQQIFDTASVADTRTRYLIHASFLEIYNEEIRDLLGNDVKAKLDLKERQDGSVFVKDLSLNPVHSVRDCQRVMDRGWKHRTVGSTLMNAVSSRSHSIFTIHVERCDEDTDSSSSSSGRIRGSKLNLVDLAGSERLSKTGATGDRQREASKINLSLSALGNVISALVDGRSKHIPYRDSKLTRLLQDSLGGNTKTLMIACLSPASDSYDETLSTLRYANRAKNIKNRPIINEDPKDALIRQYLDEINRLKAMLTGEIPPVVNVVNNVVQATQTPVPVTPSPPPPPPPPPPEPNIIEKIVHVEVPVPVLDEEQLTARTNQVVVNYESKLHQLAAELAEARAGHQRTADEMTRRLAETEANERRLREDLAKRADDERQSMRAEYEHVLGELEAVRVHRDAAQAEAGRLREQYEAEIRRVEGSVPSERVEEEKKRLKEEHEQNMCRILAELDDVKNSRRQVDEEMARLQANYEAQIGELQEAVSRAVNAAAIEQRSEPPQGDEAETVGSRDPDVCSVTESADKTALCNDSNEFIDHVQSQSPTVDLTEHNNEDSTAVSLPFSFDAVVSSLTLANYQSAAETYRRHVEVEYDGSRSRITADLEVIRQARDALAASVASIKAEYQEAIQTASRRTPNDSETLAAERRSIKADFEVHMELIKDEIERLKETRAIVLRQLDEQQRLRDEFMTELSAVSSRVDARNVILDDAVDKVKTTSDRYDKLSRQLESMTARDKEVAAVRIVEAKYGREEARIRQAVATGSISEQTASEMTEQMNIDKTRELTRARNKAIQSTITPVVEDLEQDDPNTAENNPQQQLKQLIDRRRQLRQPSAASTSSTSSSKPNSGTSTGGSRSADNVCPGDRKQIQGASHDEAIRRLRELERAMIGGKRTSSSGGTSSAVERRRNETRERLRREKRNAEEKQRQLRLQQQRLQQQQSLTSDAETPTQEGDVCVNTGRLAAKTAKTIAALRAKNESLEREIRDLQSEFELDRIDYLDAIRKQDRTLRWYQGVVDKILPALRRDVNYVDLEKIRSQSEWDDLNQTWILPRFTVERRLVFPPPTTTAGPVLAPQSSPSGSIGSINEYDLRSEDRFLERLNESAQRDPAAAYFRTGSRADQLLMMNALTASSASTTWMPQSQTSHQQQQQPCVCETAVDYTGQSASGKMTATGSSAVGSAATTVRMATPAGKASASLLPRRQHSASRMTPRFSQ